MIVLWILCDVMILACASPLISIFKKFVKCVCLSWGLLLLLTGNRKFIKGLVNHGHIHRPRAQKDSGCDVLLLFFHCLVAGLFLFSIWSALLFFFLFFVPKSYPALLLLSRTFIYHRMRGRGKRRERNREREQEREHEQNVATANGFIGMIPVINYSAPS